MSVFFFYFCYYFGRGVFRMQNIFEIYLVEKYVLKETWQRFIQIISTYQGIGRKWNLEICFQNNKIRYFIKSRCQLPPSINGEKSFLLKQVNYQEEDQKLLGIPIYLPIGSNAVDIKNHFDFKKDEKVSSIEMQFRKLYDDRIFSKIWIYTFKNNSRRKYRLFLGIASTILSVNFESNYHLFYQGAPKYLDIVKCLHLLKTNQANSIFAVSAFPYLQGNYYLEQSSIQFDKHSVVFGSSGCGKSKFLSLLIHNIYKNDLFQSKYKIVVIDPHASLEKDIGGIGRVIDFLSDENSIHLFSNDIQDILVSVELLLDVFKGLLSNSYNSKLERVLRHSLHLLLSAKRFDFKNLRRLLLELEFRNQLVNDYRDVIPNNVSSFFLAEFNDIKTKSYIEAISPIIGLVDEVEMLPFFNKEDTSVHLKDVIQSNFLTIFSLDRVKLGDFITKTISGLVMQQLFTLVQNYTFSEHIIFVIDEVAIVENSVLNRFLSEARKYNTSLILAGQYFGGISEKLQKCIFANIVNYYLFRLSKEDANCLVESFTMKIPLKDTKEEKVKMITDLQDRECIIRVCAGGNLLSAMKCRTLDFKSIPRKKMRICRDDVSLHNEKKKSFLPFGSTSNICLKDVLLTTSTSRKEKIK